VRRIAMTKFISEKVLMRIHIGENDKHGHRPLYEAIMDLLIAEGFAGATVLRGIAGFGVHSVYHTDKLLDLSSALPIIIEVVAAQEKVDGVMPKIDDMMEGGLITLENVRVVRYCDENDKVCSVREP
jgi:PII-like signaling protein